MALRRAGFVQRLSNPSVYAPAESASDMIRHINLGAKRTGKRSAGNLHTTFDAPEAGNGAKRLPRQSPTLLKGGLRNPGAKAHRA